MKFIFYLMKEAEGWPKWADTEQKQKQYIKDL